jgi:hypothetical protein
MKFNDPDLGVALHTALRKCCDSSPTSAAWNLLYELKGDQWTELLDTIRAEFKPFKFVKGGKSHDDQLAAQLKKAVLSWEPWEAWWGSALPRPLFLAVGSWFPVSRCRSENRRG